MDNMIHCCIILVAATSLNVEQGLLSYRRTILVHAVNQGNVDTLKSDNKKPEVVR